jgi:hypothetical protein
LQALDAAGNRFAGGDRVGRFAGRDQPLEMAAAELEIGAELAQRVEGIGVEEIRRALRDRFSLDTDCFAKSANRIAAWPPCEY